MKLLTLTCAASSLLLVGTLWSLTSPASAAASAAASGRAIGGVRPAAATASGITVTVVGTHVASSSYLRVSADLKVFGATGAEAVQAFEQKVARAKAGLGETAVEGIEIHMKGSNSSYGTEAAGGPAGGMAGMFMMEQGGPKEADMGLNLTQRVEVQMPTVASAAAQRGHVAEVLDTINDLGLEPLGNAGALGIEFGMMGSTRGTAAGSDAGMLEGSLDAGAKAAAELAAQKNAMDAARVQANQLAGLAGTSVGSVVSITQKSLTSKWQGIGDGVEVKATLEVTFSIE